MDILNEKSSKLKDIMDFNQSYEHQDKFLSSEEIAALKNVVLPWFPTPLDLYSLNRISSIFSKLFFGENRNNLEIRINKESKIIIESILKEYDHHGNLVGIIKNPPSLKKMEYSEITELDEFFEFAKTEIKTENGIEISNLIIIDKTFYEDYENSLNHPISDFSNWLNHQLAYLDEILKGQKIMLYPKLPLVVFYEKLRLFFGFSLDIQEILGTIMEVETREITVVNMTTLPDPTGIGFPCMASLYDMLGSSPSPYYEVDYSWDTVLQQRY